MTRGRYTVHLRRWVRPATGIPVRRWCLAVGAAAAAAAASWTAHGDPLLAGLAAVGAAATTLGVSRIGEV